MYPSETTAEEPKKDKKEKPPKKRTARIPLVVEQVEASIPALTAEDIANSKIKMVSSFSNRNYVFSHRLVVLTGWKWHGPAYPYVVSTHPENLQLVPGW